MSKTTTVTGDALLSSDPGYLLPRGSSVLYAGPRAHAPQEKGIVYLAYPSARVPRFLVPVDDPAAVRFILQMALPDTIVGFFARALLMIPGGQSWVAAVVFRECVVVAV